MLGPRWSWPSVERATAEEDDWITTLVRGGYSTAEQIVRTWSRTTRDLR